MALASAINPFVADPFSSAASQNKHLFVRYARPVTVILPRRSLSRSTLAFSRRRSKHNPSTRTSSASSPSKKKKQNPLSHDGGEDDDLDDDAFEALFSQLEEDLKKEGLAFDSDDDISEEDFAKLERALAEALDVDDTDSSDGNLDDTERDDNTEEHDDEDEQEERSLKLKSWQMRRLARALKTGRRKVSIKNLAADVCLDRATVLELLRDPPPQLLMLSATLPDDPEPTVVMPETKPMEAVNAESKLEAAEPKAKSQVPVHAMQHQWSAQKRLKKVQAETLEKVYKRTKRPTNAVISSIVLLTNLPRKRIIKWFEDKRSEDGVPEKRLPYRRSTQSTSKTLLSS